MRCMCGATDCPSCGVDQGYEVVRIWDARLGRYVWANPEDADVDAADAPKDDVWALWPDDFMCPVSEVEEMLRSPCARSDDFLRVRVTAYGGDGLPTDWEAA